MLTTKSMPKYDITGNIILPGMIVVIDWATVTEFNARIPYDFKNEAGTVTRVLRVVKPYTYHIVEGQRHSKFIEMDALYVATELVSPKSGRAMDWLRREHKNKFKDNQIVALEISYNLRRATEAERKYYSSTIFRG
jgi:acetolactate synthase regulatory subunit